MKSVLNWSVSSQKFCTIWSTGCCCSVDKSVQRTWFMTRRSMCCFRWGSSSLLLLSLWFSYCFHNSKEKQANRNHPALNSQGHLSGNNIAPFPSADKPWTYQRLRYKYLVLFADRLGFHWKAIIFFKLFQGSLKVCFQVGFQFWLIYAIECGAWNLKM